MDTNCVAATHAVLACHRQLTCMRMCNALIAFIDSVRALVGGMYKRAHMNRSAYDNGTAERSPFDSSCG
jgi:hypothetical protein